MGHELAVKHTFGACYTVSDHYSSLSSKANMSSLEAITLHGHRESTEFSLIVGLC